MNWNKEAAGIYTAKDEAWTFNIEKGPAGVWFLKAWRADGRCLSSTFHETLKNAKAKAAKIRDGHMFNA